MQASNICFVLPFHFGLFCFHCTPPFSKCLLLLFYATTLSKYSNMEGSGGCGEAECSVTDDDGSESKHFL